MSTRKEQFERMLAEQPGGMGRRELLARMGAAMALAGIGGCTRAPRDEIVPYVVQPPEVTPGIARYYASALGLDGYATGVLVETHEGRPTKIEGNPDHPASLGATSATQQAAVLSLYDPARAEGVKARGAISNWESLAAAVGHVNGRALWFLLEPTSSPSVIDAILAIRRRYPDCRIRFHALGSPRHAWNAAQAMFGKIVEPRFDLRNCERVLAIDADFVMRGAAHLRWARELGAGREAKRLYAVGPLATVTSTHADHALAMRAADVPKWTMDLLREIEQPGTRDPFLKAVARDLAAHRSIVMAGDDQPAAVHALVMLINDRLKAAVTYAPSPIFEAGETSHDIGDLRRALEAGEVETLVMAADVPGLPVDRAKTSVSLSLYETAAARASTFAIAEAHALESWGDARAFDGTLSVMQPTIAPLRDGRSLVEVLGLFTDAPMSAHDRVRARFTDDAAWRAALKKGVVDGTALAATTLTPRGAPPTIAEPAVGLEIVTALDPHLHDGRYRDAWLLELPHPITKVTWTNVATIAPALAAKSGIEDSDEIEIRSGTKRVRLPAVVVPGQSESSIGVSLGWGGDVAALGAGPVSIAKTGAKKALAKSQLHFDPPAEEKKAKRLSLYEPKKPDAPKQWGMAIDLAKCTACNACVVACQAENNVPVVGEKEVLAGRIMHWLRIDTHRSAEGTQAQPMLCQHCEKAPCEYVCPVGATVHGAEGLNEMVYNRCVGTRFCSNNCPYKVRRFNWFDFHREESRGEQRVHNPDVTVRERGVMEKCTFCVQRIRETAIHGGSPVTACQQACPSGAIVFGDIADGASEVARLQRDVRAFAALEELGTEPRVRYLARVPNRNPEIPT